MQLYFLIKPYNVYMIRILSLIIISFCFTALSIYANCDLPTGGACSLESLKKEQEKFSKDLWENNFLNKLDENYQKQQNELIKKDTPKRADFDKLNNIEINN